MSGDLTVSISEAATLVGVGKAALRRMLKDARLHGYVSPSGAKMRISVTSLATMFGLQVDVVCQAVAARRDLRLCNGEPLSPGWNDRGYVECQQGKRHAASVRLQQTSNRQRQGSAIQLSQQHASTNLSSRSGGLDPEARALLEASERSYQRAKEQYLRESE